MHVAAGLQKCQKRALVFLFDVICEDDIETCRARLRRDLGCFVLALKLLLRKYSTSITITPHHMAAPTINPSCHAFELSAFFNANRGNPVSIEFHSSSDPNPPLLTDGANIAIAKQFLIKAFVSANATFTSFLQHSPDPLLWSVVDAKTLLDASLIMLLAGAENLTAINTRRKIIIRFFDGLSLAAVVTPEEEVRFLDGVLTSQLAKHNKSPSLWYHRRWLVERYGVGVLGEYGLAGEMRIVEKSGEVHLGNYHVRNRLLRVNHTFTESLKPYILLLLSFFPG